MLADAKLPIEFWDKAAEHNSYMYNCLPIGPLTVDGEETCLEFVYTKKKPRFDQIRVWESKCYSYVNPKTLPADGRHDKLMPRGQEGVFMGYINATKKQFKVYCPDLGYTQQFTQVIVDKKVKGGKVNL